MAAWLCIISTTMLAMLGADAQVASKLPPKRYHRGAADLGTPERPYAMPPSSSARKNPFMNKGLDYDLGRRRWQAYRLADLVGQGPARAPPTAHLPPPTSLLNR